MNKLYILKFIIITIVLIFIILNLYHICSNKFKKDEDTYEKYVDDAEIERLGSLSERNRNVSQNITDTLNNIQDTANNTSIYSQLDNLRKRAQDLYNEILGDSNKCRNAYDDKLGTIAAGYDVQRNLKCTDNATDITDKYNAYSFEECANICSSDNNCSSFSFDFTNGEIEEGRCRLSSSCHKDNLTTEQDANTNVYVKKDYDKIFNYKGLKNKVCNSVCFQDGDKSSFNTETIEKCAENCYYDDECIAFEYEFPENKNEDGKCTIRTKCNENTHVKDYDTYTCFYDEMNSAAYRSPELENDELLNISINSSNEHSLIDLYKNKCKEKCDEDDGKSGRDNCKGFNLDIDEENKIVTCNLYNNLSYDDNDSSQRKEICQKPLNIRKKQLYSKVEDGTIQDRGQGDCDGLCESLVTDEIGYVKFYKKSDANKYDYIIFTNTYNITKNKEFNLADYEFIEVKFGWKAIFKGNETTSGRQVVHNYQNPGGADMNELTETNTKLDTDYDMFTRIAITNEYRKNRKFIDAIELVKVPDECLVKYDVCKIDDTTNLHKKKLVQINGNPLSTENLGTSGIGSSCISSSVEREKVCNSLIYLYEDGSRNLVFNDCSPGSNCELSGSNTMLYNELKNKPYCNGMTHKKDTNDIAILPTSISHRDRGSGDYVATKTFDTLFDEKYGTNVTYNGVYSLSNQYPDLDKKKACILSDHYQQPPIYSYPIMVYDHEYGGPKNCDAQMCKIAGVVGLTDIALLPNCALVTQDKNAPSSNTTNNSIFVGSTTELQKFLKGKKEDGPIDV